MSHPVRDLKEASLMPFHSGFLKAMPSKRPSFSLWLSSIFMAVKSQWLKSLKE